MRNILTALLVIGIIVLGFIVLKANKANQTPVDNSWPETEPATVRPTTNNSSVQNNSTSTQSTTTTPEQTYSYINSQYGFAVDITGAEVTTMNRGDDKTFQFRKDGKLIATVTPWSDSVFVDQMKEETWTFIRNVNINGQVFEQYSQSVDGSTGTTYIIITNGFTYQITTPNGNLSDIFIF
ncbi:MAG: hypothetical protein IT284_02380 [Bacteroidetes bacterium]|nr:hypothetical protein [Bacteroidota bacterium]